MFKPLTRTLALILFCAASFTACKKNKEDKLTVNQENLTGTYMISSVVVKSGGQEEDVTEDYTEACERDDEMVIKADNVVEFYDKGVSCGGDDMYEDEWYLENNMLYLSVITGEIEKLTNKSLVVTTTYPTNGDETATITWTFSRK